LKPLKQILRLLGTEAKPIIEDAKPIIELINKLKWKQVKGRTCFFCCFGLEKEHVWFPEHEVKKGKEKK